MSQEKEYHQNRNSTFKLCGIDPNNKSFSCHHLYFKHDKKTNKLPPFFPVNCRSNLIPLPIEIHNDLHALIDNSKEFKRNISTRVYLANMAFNRELDLVPERLYLSNPRDMMRSKR